MTFHEKLSSYAERGYIDPKCAPLLAEFYDEYAKTLERKGDHIDNHRAIFEVFLELVRDQHKHPFKFDNFHQQVRAPMDYFRFGIEFIRPLIDYHDSKTYGMEIFDQIEAQIANGENVVFLANHQTEADPQVMTILLEKSHPTLSEQLIFVAGERVTTDPLAIPFSMGCNLLCIYSKRYIDNPPEKKQDKQMHNKKTMQVMSELLSEGGKAIYVAPSGGRDRRDDDGQIRIADFDPAAIGMFHLMAQKSKRPTHFYPLALKTYDLLPPPATVQVELGERRQIKGGGMGMAVCPRVNMTVFPGSDIEDKHERRAARAKYIHTLVENAYATL